MKKHTALKIASIVLVMFALQFFAAPAIFPRYFPSSNESAGIFLSTITAFSLLEMLWISDRLLHWLSGDVLYFLLMLFLNHGAYGIGWVGVPLDGIVPRYDPMAAPIFVAFYMAITLVIQFVIWSGIRLIRWFLDRR